MNVQNRSAFAAIPGKRDSQPTQSAAAPAASASAAQGASFVQPTKDGFFFPQQAVQVSSKPTAVLLRPYADAGMVPEHLGNSDAGFVVANAAAGQVDQRLSAIPQFPTHATSFCQTDAAGPFLTLVQQDDGGVFLRAQQNMAKSSDEFVSPGCFSASSSLLLNADLLSKPIFRQLADDEVTSQPTFTRFECSSSKPSSNVWKSVSFPVSSRVATRTAQAGDDLFSFVGLSLLPKELLFCSDDLSGNSTLQQVGRYEILQQPASLIIGMLPTSALAAMSVDTTFPQQARLHSTLLSFEQQILDLRQQVSDLKNKGVANPAGRMIAPQAQQLGMPGSTVQNVASSFSTAGIALLGAAAVLNRILRRGPTSPA